MFPNSKLDHRTDVLAVSREYFSDVSELISTTDRKFVTVICGPLFEYIYIESLTYVGMTHGAFRDG